MSCLPRRALDSPHDALIGAAAADICVHVLDNLVARRIWLLVEQISGAHDLARLAVAALRYMLREPCLLQRMAGIVRQTFDCGYRLAGHLGNLGLAGERALAVNMHHAGAA